MPIPRTRDSVGPAILAYGLRPFFLLGALYAGVAMLVWLALLSGPGALPTAFAPRDWHVHEMLYGYLPAVIAGYLLASVPNWTGCLPLDGGRLLALVAAWLAGRIAVATSAWAGWAVAAGLDLSFLAILLVAVARETIAGRTWRNLKLVAVLAILLAGNLSFHVEAHLLSTAEHGARIGTAAVVFLVMVIGGRIVPSFTTNRLARRAPGALPAPFGRLDLIALAIAAVALASWTAAPRALPTGALLLLAGVAHAVRLARWAGHRTMGRSLEDAHLLALHVAYAFVPLGFLLVGLASVRPDLPASVGVHAWAVGGFGAMTLTVMARVAAGHTRRPILDAPVLRWLYALVVAAALARIAAGLADAHAPALLAAAGLAWAAAFLGLFALVLKPLATRKRGSPKPSPVARASGGPHPVDDAPTAHAGG